ncbi:unnamed protein product [Closterium sp. NIES-53]
MKYILFHALKPFHAHTHARTRTTSRMQTVGLHQHPFLTHFSLLLPSPPPFLPLPLPSPLPLPPLPSPPFSPYPILLSPTSSTIASTYTCLGSLGAIHGGQRDSLLTSWIAAAWIDSHVPRCKESAAVGSD